MHKGYFSISSYRRHPKIFHGRTQSCKETDFFRQKTISSLSGRVLDKIVFHNCGKDCAQNVFVLPWFTDLIKVITSPFKPALTHILRPLQQFEHNLTHLQTDRAGIRMFRLELRITSFLGRNACFGFIPI